MSESDREKMAHAPLLVLALTACATAQDPRQLKTLAAKRWTVPGIGLEMVRIPPGRFIMGSPNDEPFRRDDEAQHEVTITKPFYMGIYEVTQEQYYKVMVPDFDHDSWQYARGPLHGGLALFYRHRTGRGDYIGGKLNLDHPMECVTWFKACEFCRRITEQERKAGRLPKGYVYRLPTEAEWEYACRAGTTGPYNIQPPNNHPESLTDPGYLSSFANVGGGKTMPVGQRKPNAWGLYDMHGNVYEWCLDWHGPYPSGPVKDPTGPPNGTRRVARGGCFNGPAPYSPPGQIARGDCFSGAGPFLRSASRYSFDPAVNFYAILGFRVVLAPRLAKPWVRAQAHRSLGRAFETEKAGLGRHKAPQEPDPESTGIGRRGPAP